MKKGSLVILVVISIMALLVWFGCNPFQSQSKTTTTNLNVLENTDMVRATGGGPEGFASLNGGTTGGAGGTTVTVTDGASLIAAIAAGGPKIINVNGTVTLANSGANVIYVKRVSNISIIGINANFDGIGFKCFESSNIIFQNLKIHHTHASENGDGIEIDTSNNIWVDHCEFYNESPAVQSDVDYYDGLVDVKKASQYVTVSWNYFHDHHKGCLAGHSDSQSGGDDTLLKITYHHNYFKNIGSRTPLLRYGKIHVYNNYFLDIHKSGSNIRMGAQAKIESNVYENAGSGTVDADSGYAEGPIGTFYTSGIGYWNVANNQFINCLGNQPTTSTCSYNPPYTVTIDPVANVKSIVTSGAGLF